MKDSADIKKQNKARIGRLLAAGEELSKQQIARKTGLSVASCNTYLNEMEQMGEVLGTKKKLHEVGRNTVVYRLNEDHECFVGLYFELIGGVKSLTTVVFSPTGRIKDLTKQSYPLLDEKVIYTRLARTLEQFPNASQLVVGTPSVAEGGVIRHSDIPELEGVPLVAELEKRCGRPVFLANDMYYKVYGYYRKESTEGKIVTLVNYPAGVLPGTATVYNGSILTGRNLFAGMVGFLDYGISIDEQIQKMQRPMAMPLITRASIALISILNPHNLLFTGDLIRAEDMDTIRAACEKCIPAEYMPDFAFLPDSTPYYLAGMYEVAMDRKEDFL